MWEQPLIARLETVTDLRDEDKVSLARLCQDVRPVAAKRNIINEGDRPEFIHLIVDGWAGRYKLLANGARQIVALLIPGDFGDLHTTVLGQMDHSIIALTACQVAYIPRAQDELTSNHNGLTRALWWSTLVDEAVLRSWVVNAGRRDAYQRIAHLMCEMRLRMKMIGLVKETQFNLPLTQDELADATALTPVHVNRTLQRLRSEGLITLRGGLLTVLDVTKLEQAAGFDPSYLHIKRRTAANVYKRKFGQLRLDAKIAEPRNGKARRFDPAGFPCFGSEDPIHIPKLAAAPDSASPFLGANRAISRITVDKFVDSQCSHPRRSALRPAVAPSHCLSGARSVCAQIAPRADAFPPLRPP